MCCCCPPAIKALFCLWIRNGFSKDCVAGALTFFPPDPPMYTFRRCGSDGAELPESSEGGNAEEDPEEGTGLIMNGSGDGQGGGEGQSMEIDQGGTGGAAKSSKGEESEKERSQSAASALSERQKKLEKNARKQFARDKLDADKGVKYELVVDPTLIPARFAPYIEQMEAVKVHNKRAKSYIATVIYRARSVENANGEREGAVKTILYSHGNATDLGAMSLMQCYMARGLNVNVVMYDYSGYGESGGTPLEKNTYNDIEAVFQYVLDNVASGNPEDIVVYGQSVGSGPSCYLCSKVTVGGLILHSPFMSGMRVLTPSRALACLDIFPNIDRIKKVSCPVMIIHGMQDEEVDMAHGVALHNAVKDDLRRDPWWVPDRGHNDICDGTRNMNEYLGRLREFLASLDSGEDDVVHP